MAFEMCQVMNYLNPYTFCLCDMMSLFGSKLTWTSYLNENSLSTDVSGLTLVSVLVLNEGEVGQKHILLYHMK